MRFLSRRLILPNDLNYANSLAVGKTSITITCMMRNKVTKKTICLADDIVFVQVDPETKLPIPHGKTLESLSDSF